MLVYCNICYMNTLTYVTFSYHMLVYCNICYKNTIQRKKKEKKEKFPPLIYPYLIKKENK